MKDYSRGEPIFCNCKRVKTSCENCGREFYESQSKFIKKKRHFCKMSCYAEYRKKIPTEQQPAYKGIRKTGESKYIYSKRYNNTHKERIAHLKARRYAREQGAEGSHSLEEWVALKEKFDNCCANCLQRKKLTKDHIIPLSRGGSDFISNIQPLCRNCNSKKWNKIILVTT